MVLRGVLHKRSFRVRRRQSLLPLMFTPAVNAGAGGISTISNKEGAASEAVTVKMLRDASDDALTHMLVEARLLAAVEHPHIVRLLAVVETPQPVQLAMELCSGGDLRTALKAGALSRAGCDELAAQLDVAHQLATAVEYLHSKLCLHRDLAARNALLAQGRQEDSVARSELIVKLADVGLARAVASEEAYYRVRRGVSVGIVAFHAVIVLPQPVFVSGILRSLFPCISTPHPSPSPPFSYNCPSPPPASAPQV